MDGRQQIERVYNYHIHRGEVPFIAGQKCQAVMICGCPDRDIGKPRRVTAAARQISQAASDLCNCGIKGQNPITIKMPH